MRIKEFEAVKDFGEMFLGGEATPSLKRKLKEAFQEAFAGDYIDFLHKAEEELPLMFAMALEEAKRGGIQHTFEDIAEKWVRNHMHPVLH